MTQADLTRVQELLFGFFDMENGERSRTLSRRDLRDLIDKVQQIESAIEAALGE